MKCSSITQERLFNQFARSSMNFRVDDYFHYASKFCWLFDFFVKLKSKWISFNKKNRKIKYQCISANFALPVRTSLAILEIQIYRLFLNIWFSLWYLLLICSYTKKFKPFYSKGFTPLSIRSSMYVSGWTFMSEKKSCIVQIK